MTIEQIMQLSQAGFTAEQITALAPMISAPAPAPAPAGMADIMQQLAALTSAVHAANIRGNDNPNTERSMVDIAASILDPNPNK